MMEPNRLSGLAGPKPRTPRGVLQLGLLGLIRFGLHGFWQNPREGVSNKIVKHLWLGFMVLGFPPVFFRQILEREFQKYEAQPAFLPGFILEPPGDFLVGLHGSGVGLRGFSSNPRERVSKVWSLTAFPARMFIFSILAAWAHILPE